ncbi:MAG: molybdopterin molybdotransferase [Abditibacteriota bacterium]|nr:molybdopterin molybdotransferase [Abditibacteriota bacterium]
MRHMVSPEEASDLVLEQIPFLPAQTVAHCDALNRTLARDIESTFDVPPWDNSAMDGYGVLSRDLAEASLTTPITLPVAQTVAAGALSQSEIRPGTCARIMTGAPIPPGVDAVVMREETSESSDSVQFTTTVAAGQNIRRRGSDIARGEVPLRAGRLIRAAEWGLLASLGQAQVEVAAQPRVAIITTGAELVDVGSTLQDGQIHDSNSWTLAGLSQSSGASVVAIRHVGDDPQEFECAVQELLPQCDALLSSGGVSMGDFDPVRDVLPRIAQVHFWKIAMKPGKPVMFATHHSTGRTVPIWGLPGNPVSVMVAWEQFVRPALLKMQNRRAVKRLEVRAIIDGAHRSPQGKVEFVRALVVPDAQAATGWTARLAGDQSSGRLSSMTHANALLVVPAEETLLTAGDQVVAQMTEWPETTI